MSYIQNLWLYFVLLFGIIIVPGMDMLFVITNSLTGGRKLGFAAVFGIICGGIIHTILGVFYIGAAASLSSNVYKIIIVTGSLYMAWIGYSLVKSSIFIDKLDEAPNAPYWVVFRQGAITCLTNPKAYAFMFAVFPNFVNLKYGSVWNQAIVLGVMTSVLQFTIYGGFALLAHHSRDALVKNQSATIWISRFVGAFFIIVAAYSLWHGIRA